MPKPAKSGKPTAPKPPEQSAPAAEVAVRMLVGAHAGQIVRVPRAKVAEMVNGWQPVAELVAVNRAGMRETR